MGKCRRTFTSHVYVETTHFRSLWSNIYQHFTFLGRVIDEQYTISAINTADKFV